MTLNGLTTEAIVSVTEQRPLSSTRTQLEAIDWSFTKRERAHPIEAIHPYPAKFIGEIPRALLRTLPCQKGTLVFDPFAGSGTTLLEAQRQGLPSIGIDLRKNGV